MSTLALTEAEWQTQVVDLLHIHGWTHLHVRRSIGRRGGKAGWQTTTNIAGWPDLFAWHPEHGFAALELKSERGRATVDQRAVLASLAEAGAVTLVARPSDLDDVIAVLRGDYEREGAA